jgi:hypothetical protein
MRIRRRRRVAHHHAEGRADGELGADREVEAVDTALLPPPSAGGEGVVAGGFSGWVLGHHDVAE